MIFLPTLPVYLLFTALQGTAEYLNFKIQCTLLIEETGCFCFLFLTQPYIFCSHNGIFHHFDTAKEK